MQKVLTAVFRSWVVFMWGYSSVTAHDGSTVSRVLADKTQGHCVEKEHCQEPQVSYCTSVFSQH